MAVEKVDRYAPRLASVCTRMARNLPSLSIAISGVACMVLPVRVAEEGLDRSEVHLMARLSCLEPQVSATSSA